MSLAELKRRLAVGVRLRLVERPGQTGLEEMKRVALVQTNAIAFGPPDCKRGDLCWIWWAKGQRVETTHHGFKLLWPNGNFLRYEWAVDEPPAAPPIAGEADVEREAKLDAPPASC